MTDKSQSRERIDAAFKADYATKFAGRRMNAVSFMEFYEAGWQAALADQPAVAGAAGENVMGIGNMLARCIDDCRKYGWDEWAYEDRLVKLMQEHGSSIVKHLRTPAPSPAVGGEEE